VNCVHPGLIDTDMTAWVMKRPDLLPGILAQISLGRPGEPREIGTVVAFFGTGFFSGSGIIGSEIFPTSVRARALGFTYNGARTMSSVAPYVIGRVGQAKGLSWAFYLCGLSFLLACMVATQLPETKGKQLE